VNDDLSDFSMMDLFRVEAETQVAALTEGLIGLENDPQASGAKMADLMRAAHSLKGAARIVNLELAIGIAHAMEDCFVAAQEGRLVIGADDVDVILRSVDFLANFGKLTDAEVAEWSERHRAEAAVLEAQLRETGASRPAAPATPAPSEAAGLGDFSMTELFLAEAGTQSVPLNSGLLALEARPEDPELLRSLERAAHSLKGAARIVGVEPIVRLTHAMEDCFVQAKEGKFVLAPRHLDVLLRASDLVGSLSKLAERELASWLLVKAGEIEGLVRDISKIPSGEPLSAPYAPVIAAEPVLAQPPPPAAPVESKPEERRPAAPTAAARGEPADRVVRVGAENLNRLMELAAESLVEAKRIKPFADAMLKLKSAQNRVETGIAQLRDSIEREHPGSLDAVQFREIETRLAALRQMVNLRIEDFEGILRRTTGLSDRLYHEVIASRMRPFGDGVAGFPRLARDLARTLGKKVRFTISGKTTEVDRDILEKLEAPLNHILRNALDHGLETPAERAALGKPEEGTLKIEAKHAAGMLYIAISDDGRGVDRDRLRRKIIEKSMVPAAAAAQLTDAELLEFLFLPGFSTAEKITEVSGRGVGLDVVQTMMQEVGGAARIVSQAGAGTTFHLQLPITRSVIRALIVEIAGEPYAFPLPKIDRVLEVLVSELETVEGRIFARVNEKNVGIVPAWQILELERKTEAREFAAILVLSDRNHQYGLEVDRFLGERDLVARPLDPRLGKVADISSASLLEDGSPVLIVDVDDLARSIDNLLDGGRMARNPLGGGSKTGGKRKRVLVTDDSITVRELERQLLHARGYEVDTAVDGMEGWNAVRLGHYDLVVSDVDMPRMTGIEFVKLIRADEELEALPVIIVSYKDREEDRLRGLEAGANYYLTKSSFQDDTFLNAVRDLIGKAVE
jgi:two-component system sensor histidine kinase and response regulator WspE